MATGSLTALQLDAAAGLLQNQGIAISSNLTVAIDAYEGTSLISPFFAIGLFLIFLQNIFMY